ncbi:hypothetical protein MAP00_006957 [Monascus purpureus]|nr:hypothetical protein MAP00_006957 [Monascus purpureus]
MARNEVFDGPISESIPSSSVSFIHRRGRQDSTGSLTYLQNEDDSIEWPTEDAMEVEGDITRESADSLAGPSLESARPSFGSKRLSYPSGSLEEPLLPRGFSTNLYTGDHKTGSRCDQKIYIESEDLTAVFSGFCTSTGGLILYASLCIVTFGLGYLFLRWFPKWRTRLIGRPTPFWKCQWIAIEDQWNGYTLHTVSSQNYGRPISTVFPVSRRHFTHYDEDNDPVITCLRHVDYRYLRFFYHPLEDRLFLISGWKDSLWTNTKVMRGGLDADDRDSRERIFGKNLIDIKQKSVPQLLADEAFHPFYIFQIASLVLWSLDEYYYYAVCIFLISVFSIGATLIETRSTMQRLREISHFECFVRVLRNGFWRSVPSQELVPGDVFEFSDPSLTQVPCDCLLLSGDCIVNESMLTGESVPVSKVPLTDDALGYLNLDEPSIHPNVAKHFLFGGTKIIRSRRPQDVGDDEAIALAIVVRTGFLTTKGALVRSMILPKPTGFRFYRDSFRYISVMGAIAVLGFVASFVNFVRLGLPWHIIIVRALDLITIVVPPALPATLTIGTNFALSRLKSRQIFCITPQKVNVGGKLDVVCFDKTGTLTEDGLDVLGVRTIGRDMRFSDLVSRPSVAASDISVDPNYDYEKHKNIVYTMATCHSLKVVDNELLGDPLDVKMFQFTGWSYQEGESRTLEQNIKYDTIVPSVAKPPYHISNCGQCNTHAGLELGILRSFEFIPELRRASVIAKQFGDGGVSFFVKGAPESVRAICLPESLPLDFEEVLSQYTHKGYRVIACAMKYKQKLNWMKVQKMSREEAECGLEFLGFIIFENKLKPTTASVITELNQAGIHNIMCTGDNILTAVSVARECGLIEQGEHCFIPHFVEDPNFDGKPFLQWVSIDNPTLELDGNTLMPLCMSAIVDLAVPDNNYNMRKYSVAVSGDVFRWIVDFGNENVLRRMLVCGKVFARMSPDEKHELVQKLQSLDYCCGFCGDGANDCGALKAADVGISLSDAEASVAAPFTSRIFDISCVPTLIKEGRAALVTSFCCFKYMSLYSAIQFTSVSFLYTSASNLGDFQFLFIDLLIILPIAVFMGWTGPCPMLSRKRPTANLVSRKVLVPLLGQIAICVLVQFTTYKTVQLQPWYKPPRIDLENANIENSDNTSLFLTSCFQYVFMSLVLSVGPPFRTSVASNMPLLCTIIMDLAFISYMLFEPSRWLADVMQLTFLSGHFKFWLFVLAIGGFLFSWVAERKLFPSLSRLLGRSYTLFRPNYRKQRRQYKVLLDDMWR